MRTRWHFGHDEATSSTRWPQSGQRIITMMRESNVLHGAGPPTPIAAAGGARHEPLLAGYFPPHAAHVPTPDRRRSRRPVGLADRVRSVPHIRNDRLPAGRTLPPRRGRLARRRRLPGDRRAGARATRPEGLPGARRPAPSGPVVPCGEPTLPSRGRSHMRRWGCQMCGFVHDEAEGRLPDLRAASGSPQPPPTRIDISRTPRKARL